MSLHVCHLTNLRSTHKANILPYIIYTLTIWSLHNTFASAKYCHGVTSEVHDASIPYPSAGLSHGYSASDLASC